MKNEKVELDETVAALVDELVGKAFEKAMTKYAGGGGKSFLEALANGGEVKEPENIFSSWDPFKGKGCDAARMLRVAALVKSRNISRKEAAGTFKTSEKLTKALEAYDAESGGFLVPTPVSSEIIEILRPTSVVMRAGPRLLQIPNGNYSFNIQSVSAVAYYVGECMPVTPSNPKFGRQKLIAHRLNVLVPICNDFLRYTGPDVDAFIREDMVNVLATKTDQAFLRGNGVQDSPKGFRYMAIPGNVRPRTLDGGSVTIDSVVHDLITMQTDLRLRNIPLARGAWFMEPRTLGFMQMLQNGLGLDRFPSLQGANPTLNGMPVFSTTNIPNNLGVAGDEAEIYLVDMSQIVVGQAVELDIVSSPDASYLLGNTHHHGLQEDFTLVAARTAHDIMDLRQGASIAVLTGVDWGAP